MSKAHYSIGAVSSLTGLSPSTIRTWERRYSAVEPSRTEGGGRRYSEEDVERVQLLLALTRGGEAISVVARLPLDSLRARLQQLKAMTPVRATAGTTVAVLHSSLCQSFEAAENLEVELSLAASSLASFRNQPQRSTIDLLFVELDLLGERAESELEALLEETSAAKVVVEYGFARSHVLEALAQMGAQVVRGPLRVSDVVRFAHAAVAARRVTPSFVAPSVPSDAPEPRFTPARLAKLREISAKTECECPNQVATLVTALTAFENYSKSCVVDEPQDAELHAGLAYGTGRARAVMEELLMRLCEYEGIEV